MQVPVDKLKGRLHCWIHEGFTSIIYKTHHNHQNHHNQFAVKNYRIYTWKARSQVPVDVTGVPSMYVFVDIGIDVAHLADSVRLNFERGARLALAGTIQFAGSIQACHSAMPGRDPNPTTAP